MEGNCISQKMQLTDLEWGFILKHLKEPKTKT